MKKLLLIILLPFLLGCGNDKEKTITPEQSKQEGETFDTTAIETVPVTGIEDEEFIFNYKVNVNDKFRYRITQIAESTEKITADTTISQRTKQTAIYVITTTVNDVDPDNVMEISFSISSVKVDAEANGQKFSYQSGTTLDSLDKLRFSEYEAMINSPFSARIDSKGDILEIFRTDRIGNKIIDMRGWTDSLSAVEKNQLYREIAEGALRPLIVQIFRKLPSQNIKVNSKWDFPQPEAQMGSFMIKSTNHFNLTGIEKFSGERLAVIDAGLTTTARGQNKVTDRGILYEFKTPSISGDGKIYFNLDKGIIQKSMTKTIVKNYVTMESQPPQPKQRMTNDATILNTNIIELL